MSNAFAKAWNIAKEEIPFGPVHRDKLSSGYSDCPKCRGTMDIMECEICANRADEVMEERERREEEAMMAEFLDNERRDQMGMDEAFGVDRDAPNLPPPKSEGGGDMRQTEKRPIGREDEQDNKRED